MIIIKSCISIDEYVQHILNLNFVQRWSNDQFLIQSCLQSSFFSFLFFVCLLKNNKITQKLCFPSFYFTKHCYTYWKIPPPNFIFVTCFKSLYKMQFWCFVFSCSNADHGGINSRRFLITVSSWCTLSISFLISLILQIRFTINPWFVADSSTRRIEELESFGIDLSNVH